MKDPDEIGSLWLTKNFLDNGHVEIVLDQPAPPRMLIYNHVLEELLYRQTHGMPPSPGWPTATYDEKLRLLRIVHRNGVLIYRIAGAAPSPGPMACSLAVWPD